MFLSPKHRPDSDRGSPDLRAPDSDSGIWSGGPGRSRSGRHELQTRRQTRRHIGRQTRRKTESLLQSNRHQDEVGVRGSRERVGRECHRQRAYSSLTLDSFYFLHWRAHSACVQLLQRRSARSLRIPSIHERQDLVHGELKASRQEAERGYRRVPQIRVRNGHLRFRILEARSLLEQGLFAEVVKLLIPNIDLMRLQSDLSCGDLDTSGGCSWSSLHALSRG